MSWVVATKRKFAFASLIFAAVMAAMFLFALFFFNFHEWKTTARWLLHSHRYKVQVLAQPTPPNGELRHIEWDGWGGFGSDTEVYLVFDPDDSLREPAYKHASGKFNGIPCEVPQVHQLEKNWYTVQYYTNEGWNQCQ